MGSPCLPSGGYSQDQLPRPLGFRPDLMFSVSGSLISGTAKSRPRKHQIGAEWGRHASPWADTLRIHCHGLWHASGGLWGPQNGQKIFKNTDVHVFRVPRGGDPSPWASLLSRFGMHTAIAILLSPWRDAAMWLSFRTTAEQVQSVRWLKNGTRQTEVTERHPPRVNWD